MQTHPPIPPSPTLSSCINRVLERRLGIPITLALVYLEVSKRVGLELSGVNIPGHFFLTPTDPDLQFLVDVFEGKRCHLPPCTYATTINNRRQCPHY
jgi:regulator of sirC expression with transglutaminase-like and TPR domain